MRYFYVSKYFGNYEFDLIVTYCFFPLLTGIIANVRTTFSTMSLQVQNCKFTNQGQKVNILKQSELQRKTIFFSIGLSIFISSPIPYLSRWNYLYWIVHKDFRLQSPIFIGIACTSAISWFPQRHLYLSATFKLRSRFQDLGKNGQECTYNSTPNLTLDQWKIVTPEKSHPWKIFTPEKFFSEKYSGPGSTKPWVNIFLMENFFARKYRTWCPWNHCFWKI